MFVLLVDFKGRKYLVAKGQDLHCNFGMIKWVDIEAAGVGNLVKSNKNKFFNIATPNIIDYIEKAKRGPQAMTLKDMSLVAGYAGIKSGSKVLEAGTGSGLFTMYLAHTVYPQKITTYEIREDFRNIALKNFTRFEIENVDSHLRDIYGGIEGVDYEAVLLDLTEPWKVVPHLEKALKMGGTLVSYSPSINQSRQLVEVLDGYMHETFETILRNWKADKMSPNTRMLGHTGFLTIARKMRQPNAKGEIESIPMENQGDME